MKNVEINVGKIPAKIGNILKTKDKEDLSCYIPIDTNKDFYLRWGETYKDKMKEVKKILRSPSYISFDKKLKEICLIKDYCTNGNLLYCGLILLKQEKIYIRNLLVFNEERIKERRWKKC